jgi:hypothetical protein
MAWLLLRDCDDREFHVPAIDGLETNREAEEMRSLTLAVWIVVMLLVAAAAQASDKDIVVPRSHPAAAGSPVVNLSLWGTWS